MLVGCGPHARRVYVPAFFLQNEYDAIIKVIVELEKKELETREFISQYSTDVEYFLLTDFVTLENYQSRWSKSWII